MDLATCRTMYAPDLSTCYRHRGVYHIRFAAREVRVALQHCLYTTMANKLCYIASSMLQQLGCCAAMETGPTFVGSLPEKAPPPCAPQPP